MSESGQEALPNVLEWSGGHFECPGVFERLSWMYGSVWEDFPYVR